MDEFRVSPPPPLGWVGVTVNIITPPPARRCVLGGSRSLQPAKKIWTGTPPILRWHKVGEVPPCTGAPNQLGYRSLGGRFSQGFPPLRWSVGCIWNKFCQGLPPIVHGGGGGCMLSKAPPEGHYHLGRGAPCARASYQLGGCLVVHYLILG